jgi:hypothetical protein
MPIFTTSRIKFLINHDIMISLSIQLENEAQTTGANTFAFLFVNEAFFTRDASVRRTVRRKVNQAILFSLLLHTR